VIRFYKKLRVGGPGWRRIAQQTNISALNLRFGHSVLGWLTCSLTLYAVLLGTGALLFQRWGLGLLFVSLAVAGTALLLTVFRSTFGDASDANPDHPSGAPHPVANTQTPNR